MLKEAGLLKNGQCDTRPITETLEESGLTDDNLADELTHLALHSNNETLRLRAIETALKVKGALKETAPIIPTFTVIINNSSKDLTKTEGVSPILFPRQSLKDPKEEIN